MVIMTKKPWAAKREFFFEVLVFTGVVLLVPCFLFCVAKAFQFLSGLSFSVALSFLAFTVTAMALIATIFSLTISIESFKLNRLQTWKNEKIKELRECYKISVTWLNLMEVPLKNRNDKEISRAYMKANSAFQVLEATDSELVNQMHLLREILKNQGDMRENGICADPKCKNRKKCNSTCCSCRVISDGRLKTVDAALYDELVSVVMHIKSIEKYPN